LPKEIANEEKEPEKPTTPPINMPFLMTKMLEKLNIKQSLKKDMICSAHGQMATFFSDQEKRYKCQQCLLVEQNLHFVDESF
jgi:hypothetical protein